MNTIQEKPLFDLSDQMSAYNSPLKKTGKWYRKLASELFLNAAVVNVLVMFQNVRGRKMSITTFRNNWQMRSHGSQMKKCQSREIENEQFEETLNIEIERIKAFITNKWQSQWEAEEYGRENIYIQDVTFSECTRG